MGASAGKPRPDPERQREWKRLARASEEWYRAQRERRRWFK